MSPSQLSLKELFTRDKPDTHQRIELTKAHGTAVQRIGSHVISSRRARRVTERGLKREYVHAPLHSMCGMAMPQLMWVNVEPCGSYPLAANLPDGCWITLSAVR